MKLILFSQHAVGQMQARGATRPEVEEAIRSGEQLPARKGRVAFRKNFGFHNRWKGSYYEVKQVVPIAVEEKDRFVVVTVYVFYFGGNGEN